MHLYFIFLLSEIQDEAKITNRNIEFENMENMGFHFKHDYWYKYWIKQHISNQQMGNRKTNMFHESANETRGGSTHTRMFSK